MLKLHKEILICARINIIKQTLFIKRIAMLLLKVDKTVFRFLVLSNIICDHCNYLPPRPHKGKIS